MKTSPPLTIDRIILDSKATTAMAVRQLLARQAAADIDLPAPFLFDRLLDQERRSPSGVGGGVAIIPLRLARVTEPYVLFARSRQAVEFAALDSRPVDLFFLMLSSNADMAGHLQRLAQLSRLMRDAQFCANLRGIEQEDGLAALLLAMPASIRAA